MRVQSDHWAVLLDFCEAHPESITNKFASGSGRDNFNKLWTELTLSLNSIGLGEKSTDEWKKTLTDWKSKTKAKAGGLSTYKKTGGGGPPSITISTFEERLLKLMGRTAVDGNITVQEIGLKRRKIDYDIAQCHSVVSNIKDNLPTQSTSTSKDSPAIFANPTMISRFNYNDNLNICNSNSLYNINENLNICGSKSNSNPSYRCETIEEVNIQSGLSKPTNDVVGVHTALLKPKPTRVAKETSNSNTEDNNNKRRNNQTSSINELKHLNDNVLVVLKSIDENISLLNLTLREFIPIMKKMSDK